MSRVVEACRAVAGDAVKRVGRVAGRLQEAGLLPPDVLEGDDAYLVVFDAPGAAASDVQVRYKRGAIEVRIDRFREHFEGFEMRFPGRGMSLDGRARLPDDASVDADAASATLRENGTLEVRVPKEAGGAGGGGRRVVVEEADAPDATES